MEKSGLSINVVSFLPRPPVDTLKQARDQLADAFTKAVDEDETTDSNLDSKSHTLTIGFPDFLWGLKPDEKQQWKADPATQKFARDIGTRITAWSPEAAAVLLADVHRLVQKAQVDAGKPVTCSINLLRQSLGPDTKPLFSKMDAKKRIVESVSFFVTAYSIHEFGKKTAADGEGLNSHEQAGQPNEEHLFFLDMSKSNDDQRKADASTAVRLDMTHPMYPDGHLGVTMSGCKLPPTEGKPGDVYIVHGLSFSTTDPKDVNGSGISPTGVYTLNQDGSLTRTMSRQSASYTPENNSREVTRGKVPALSAAYNPKEYVYTASALVRDPKGEQKPGKVEDINLPGLYTRANKLDLRLKLVQSKPLPRPIWGDDARDQGEGPQEGLKDRTGDKRDPLRGVFEEAGGEGDDGLHGVADEGANINGEHVGGGDVPRFEAPGSHEPPSNRPEGRV